MEDASLVVFPSDSCDLENLTHKTYIPSFGVFQKLACKSWEPFGHPKPRVPGVDTFLALLGYLQMVFGMILNMYLPCITMYCSISVGKTNSMTARFDIDHLSMLPGHWPFPKPGILDIFHAIGTWHWQKTLPVEMRFKRLTLREAMLSRGCGDSIHPNLFVFIQQNLWIIISHQIVYHIRTIEHLSHYILIIYAYIHAYRLYHIIKYDNYHDNINIMPYMYQVYLSKSYTYIHIVVMYTVYCLVEYIICVWKIYILFLSWIHAILICLLFLPCKQHPTG